MRDKNNDISNWTNDHKPFFSILVPVYNVEAYIEECLNSVQSQSEENYEVILVDDGSTDRSGLICDQYCREHPEHFRVIHKPNEGLISARRVAIREAIGTYCIFLDSDDMLEKNCLVSLKKYVFEQLYDMVIYRYDYFIQETKSRRRSTPVFNGNCVFSGIRKEEIYKALAIDNKINNICIKMIKTEILQSDPTDYTKFYANPFGEDALQSLFPVTAAIDIAYYDKPLYLYRIHVDSMIHNFDKDNMMRRYHNVIDDEKTRYMHIWGIDTKENLEQREANSIKNIIDTIVYHMEHAENMTPAVEFADEFVCKYRDCIRMALESKHLSMKVKIPIYLLYRKHFNTLILYYKTARRLHNIINYWR